MQMILHTVALIALVAAYVIVTVTGNDGNPLLGAIGGYLGGAVVEKRAPA